jgi:hypothetical protein
MKFKSIIKTTSKTNVTINDWLVLKPYLNHTNYDLYYLEIANTILEELRKYTDEIKLYDLDTNNLKKLSCILTSYFEDYISNIGLWRTFTVNNMELHGYHLPFYDLRDYEFDGINKQDIMYLCWQYLISLYDDALFNPDAEWFQRIAYEVYTLFKSEEHEALNTEYYETFFAIPEKSDYFIFKEKLHWLAMKSYLIGVHFDEDYRYAVEDLYAEVEKSGNEYRPEHLHLINYTMLNQYMHTKRSCFNAMTAPEWFSKLADCSPEKREEIYQLQYPHQGWYECNLQDKKHFYLTNIVNNKEYKVLLNSVKSRKLDTKIIHDTTLIKWDKEWWVTGSMIGIPKTAKEIETYKAKPILNSWILDESVTVHQRNYNNNLLANFKLYYRQLFALAKNYKETETIIANFMKFNAKQLGQEAIENKAINLSQYANKQDFVVFVTNQGVQIANNVNSTIALLQKKTFSSDEFEEAFFEILQTSNSVELNDMLFEKFASNAFLKFPNGSQVGIKENKDFLFRFFNPEDTAYDKYPMIMSFEDTK